MANIRRPSRQRGQAIAEMGLVILLFTVLTLGIIDFGRMLMVMNVVAHAARDGARAAAVVPSDQWAATTAALQTRVQDQVEAVTGASLTAAAGCSNLAEGPAVTMNVSGDVPFIFSFPGLWGGSITMNRTATFRYEPATSCP